MTAAVPKTGLEERLAQLREQRLRLEGQIAEVEFWLALCEQVEQTSEEAA